MSRWALWVRYKGDIIMTKITVALIALTFVLGSAACTDASTAASLASVSTSAMQYKNGDGAASNPNVPGATGRTIIPGNNSTITGDAEATRQQQTGAYGG
jgi:hypothetical protein